MLKDDKKNQELSKDERILKEFKKLKTTFKNIEKDKLKIVEKLMERAAFMSITLSDLEIDMNENGVISKYQNGEFQSGTKKSPSVEIYNSMIKNYSLVIKQLSEYVPESSKSIAGNNLMVFANKKVTR